MARPTVIIGNWKMYKTIEEAREFIRELKAKMTQTQTPAQVGLAVPYTIILAASEFAAGSSISIGAQNVNEAEEGAFTGEISCRMLRDVGATFVIIGHSERRRLFHEDDGTVNRKLKRVLTDGLRAIVCIGETLEQHQNGQVESVLRSQIEGSLEGIAADQFRNIIIAYEPVWAIGTGKTATPEIAEKAHAFCREVISQKWGRAIADNLVIQYGGSVKPDNAVELLAKPDVDGFLIGGASLSVDSFVKIIYAAR